MDLNSSRVQELILKNRQFTIRDSPAALQLTIKTTGSCLGIDGMQKTSLQRRSIKTLLSWEKSAEVDVNRDCIERLWYFSGIYEPNVQMYRGLFLFQRHSPNYEKRQFVLSGLSVRLSVRQEQLCSHWTNVHEIGK
jgi:hypothetical protein